jgi:DNA segregation ATPase FtsK/SpoIIIE, S-DNA-T family
MAEKNNKFKSNTFKSKKEPKTDLSGNEFSFKTMKGFFHDGRLRKITGTLLIITAFYMLLAFTSYFFNWKFDDSTERSWGDLLFDKDLVVNNMMGRLGYVTAKLFIKKWFGIASYLFILAAVVLGIKLLVRKSLLPVWKTINYSLFSLIWISVAFGFLFRNGELLILSGTFGYQSNVWLQGIFGNAGTFLILIFTLASVLIIAFNWSYETIKNFILKIIAAVYTPKAIPEDSEDANTEVSDTTEVDIDDITNDPEDDLLEDAVQSESDLIKSILSKAENNDLSFEVVVGEDAKADAEVAAQGYNNPELEIEISDGKIRGNNYQEVEDPTSKDIDGIPDLSHLKPYDPKEELSDYKMPPINLLKEYGSNVIEINKEELEANKNRILETLNNYSIQIDKIRATVGPTVTLYEIVPAPGVRISKIKNLENDIALSLSALGIRIIAPIPGKGTIGIEVPNSKPEIVSMHSILSSEKFQKSNFELPIGLGKTIANEIYIADLVKMPHLLMAGATGQGKSVGLNAVLASILYKKHPAEVKFVLVDPKKVELTLFSKIERHYLAKLPDSAEAIITDTRKVVRTLNSLTIEMNNRYDLLKDAQVRNIQEYNAKFIARKLNPNNGHNFLPYIILFIDEFADLIMTAGKEVELPITRLAQLARAIGIHLVIATQRPSVNIITGTIKANFPARIAFRVTSKIDSRTILDTGGADQLIGRGDMLLSTGSDIIRLQCAFIDTPEIDNITEFIGSQRAYPHAFELPECDEESDNPESVDDGERDELFDDAARIIVATQQGSTSLLQRKLKLGYNRAGRIIDQLEAAGIVGPFEGSKAREVRIKDEVALEQILRRND